MSEALKEIQQFKKQVLRKLLKSCTPSQMNMFNRMYGSIDNIAEDKIEWAIQQAERTVKENIEKGVVIL